MVRTSAWAAFLTVFPQTFHLEEQTTVDRRHRRQQGKAPTARTADAARITHIAVSEHITASSRLAHCLHILHFISSSARRTFHSSGSTGPLSPIQTTLPTPLVPQSTSTPLSTLVPTLRLSTPSTRERRAYTSGFAPAKLREGRRETAVGLWPVPESSGSKSARRPPF